MPAATPSRPSAILVLGMHRSGTSLLARLLQIAGVRLGQEPSLAGPAADNPRGFWEHAGLREVNDGLLAAFGGSWLAPPELPADWTRDPRAEPWRARAREILRAEFGGGETWGFKDPRSSLLAEFWRELAPRPVAWVLAVRHPLEVAASLERRDGIPLALAEDLWNEYTRSALAGAPECARAIVHYARLLADPVAEIERLLAALGWPAGPLDPGRRAAIAGEARPELRHHQGAGDEARLAPVTLDLHRQLLAGVVADPLAGWREGAPTRRGFRGLAAAFARELAARRSREAALTDRESEIRAATKDTARWRDEALQLRHARDLLLARAECRAGEAVRRLLRRRKGLQAPSGAAEAEWRTREDSNL